MALSTNPATYFKLANPFLTVLTIVGMTLCHLGCYNPKIVPDQYLGPIGWFYRFLVYTHPMAIQVVYHSAVAVHFGEAFYSIHLAKVKGITDQTTQFKWFFQTLVVGISSLYFLINYTPKKRS